MKPTRTTERGFTLAELTVALSLAVAIVAAGASLLTDYMATARTLRVQGDANIELISLIKNLTREFQTSRQSSRACVLQRISGNPGRCESDPRGFSVSLSDHKNRRPWL